MVFIVKVALKSNYEWLPDLVTKIALANPVQRYNTPSCHQFKVVCVEVRDVLVWVVG